MCPRIRIRIISGVSAFQAFASAAEVKGAWSAWNEHCFKQHASVYELIQRVLYQNDQPRALRPFVEAMDLDKARRRVRRFLEDDADQHVRRLLRSAERVCLAPERYSVYLLPGWGQIDGTSLPGIEPFVFFGLEMYESLEYLECLVPHEYCHMVRNVAVLEEEMRRGPLTIEHVVIAEGLATLFPVLLRGEPIGLRSIISGGMMAERAAAYCVEHEDALFEEIEQVWDQPLSPELTHSYLSSCSTGWIGQRPAKIGYYVGSRIVGELVNRGYDLCELTRLPTRTIWKLFRSA